MTVRGLDFYKQVARLHMDGIDRGFLRQLGPAFLTLMYDAIDRCPGSVLITEEQDGVVVGFISGAASLKPVYKYLLMRPLHLAFALVPSLLRPSRVKRIWEILRYSRQTHAGSDAELPEFELLSIVVATSHRGSGCAERLYRALEQHCQQNHVPAFKIVVGDALEPAHRFYKRMGAVASGRTEVHQGEGSVVYVQQIASIT